MGGKESRKGGFLRKDGRKFGDEGDPPPLSSHYPLAATHPQYKRRRNGPFEVGGDVGRRRRRRRDFMIKRLR